MCDDRCVPAQEITAKNANVMIVSSAHGTHCCHLTGFFKPRPWYPVPFMEFLNYFESRA